MHGLHNGYTDNEQSGSQISNCGISNHIQHFLSAVDNLHLLGSGRNRYLCSIVARK